MMPTRTQVTKTTRIIPEFTRRSVFSCAPCSIAEEAYRHVLTLHFYRTTT